MRQFFEILCYGWPRNWFIWHSPRGIRVHSGPKNVCLASSRNIWSQLPNLYNVPFLKLKKEPGFNMVISTVPGKCGTKASSVFRRLEVEQSLGTQDDHSDHGPTRHSWLQGTKQLENYMHDIYLRSLVMYVRLVKFWASKTSFSSLYRFGR